MSTTPKYVNMGCNYHLSFEITFKHYKLRLLTLRQFLVKYLAHNTKNEKIAYFQNSISSSIFGTEKF